MRAVRLSLGGFALLLAADAVHAAAFFLVLKQIGEAVGSALMKGRQAVTVVLLSAFFFCAREECIIVLVIAGTLL